jgi:type VI secretion system FHA domain protein
MLSLKLTQGVDLVEGVTVDMRLPEPLTRFSIGRDPSNQWVIPDRTLAISARHCEIVATPAGPALRDISTNGTFVNGASTRLNGPHLLRDGDRVALGPFQFTVIGPKLATASAPMPLPELTGAPPPPARLPATPTYRGGDPAAMLAPGAAQAQRPGVTEILRSAPPPDDSSVDLTRIRVAPPKARDAGGERTPPPTLRPVPAPPTAVTTPTPVPPPPAAAATLTQPMPLERMTPPPPVAPPPGPASSSAEAGSGPDRTLHALAAGLGVDASAWAGRDPAEVAEHAGALARHAVAALMQLLQQQAAARRQIGSRAPALVAVREVNLLRVASSPEAAVNALLAPGADVAGPLQRAASELSAHQDRLMAAFRGAALRLGEELAPDSLDAAVGGSGGAAQTAQRWELYKSLWQGLGLAPGQPWSKGFLEAALLHLAASYDEQGKA